MSQRIKRPEASGVRLRKLGKAAGEGVKDTVAVALISLGVQQIQSGDYIAGGALVVIGWMLLVVDRYLL